MSDQLITVRDLSAILRLGQRTIWRRIADGTLPPPIRIGRAVRFRRPTIEKWLQTLEEQNKTKIGRTLGGDVDQG